MKKLLCSLGKSEIRDQEIIIKNYPFEPSVVYKEKSIKATEIEAVCLDFTSPKLYLAEDVVFIAAEQKDNLKAFVDKNNIILVPYNWNWDWILEPFLDTKFSEENKKHTIELLIKNGIAENEIKSLRKEVESQMLAYNFKTMLWEWVSLNLFDVLSAMRAKYNKTGFEDFYRRAVDIEKRTAK